MFCVAKPRGNNAFSTTFHSQHRPASSKMQRGLDILDIRLLICKEIDTFSVHRGRTLSALARSCRSFKDPALGTLWHSLSTLDPLFSCLPEDLWSPHGKNELVCSNIRLSTALIPLKLSQMLQRPIKDSDLIKFKTNAKRVRNIELGSGYLRHGSAVDASSTQILTLSLAGSFYNLQKLRVELNPKSLPWVTLLLGKKITDLRVVITSAAIPVIAFFPVISAKATSVRELTIDSDLIWQENTTEVFSDHVCTWKNLRTLSIRELDTRAVVHLASMTSLTSLTFCVNQAMTLDPPPLTFQHVSRLHVIITDAKAWAAFIHSASFPCLDNLSMGASSTTSSRYLDIIYPALETLLQSPLAQLGFRYESAAQPRPPKEDLHTLFSFRHLLVVSLYLAIDLDDSLLQAVSVAWPKLISLVLHVLGDPPPLVTVMGIIRLSQNCRNLRTLGIAINGDVLPSLVTVTQAIRAPNRNLRCLGLFNSWMSKPAELAVILSLVFPNLTSIQPLPSAGEADLFSSRCGEVARLVQLFSAGYKYKKILSKRKIDEGS